MMNSSWWIISLLAVFFGLAAPADDMAAAVSASASGKDVMDSVLTTVGNMVDRAILPADVLYPSDTADNNNNNNNLRRAAVPSPPYSQAIVAWGAGSSTCNAASTTMIISCPVGGYISVLSFAGLSNWTSFGANAVKCVTFASSTTASSAFMIVKCTGKYVVTATLPKRTFTNCYNAVPKNLAFQLINMGQFCDIKDIHTYNLSYTKQCANSSQVYYDKVKKIPSCLSQSTRCVDTSKTTCSITTDAVKLSTPAPTSARCIAKGG